MQNIVILLLLLITIVVSTSKPSKTLSKYDYIQQSTNNLENKEPQYQYIPYGFGYEIEDGFGNKNWRREDSQGENKVSGVYGFIDSNGISRQVEYTADQNGFRAQIKTTEPGTAPKNPAHVSIDSHPSHFSQQKSYGQQQQRLSSNQNTFQKSASANNPTNYGRKY